MPRKDYKYSKPLYTQDKKHLIYIYIYIYIYIKILWYVQNLKLALNSVCLLKYFNILENSLIYIYIYIYRKKIESRLYSSK